MRYPDRGSGRNDLDAVGQGSFRPFTRNGTLVGKLVAGQAEQWDRCHRPLASGTIGQEKPEVAADHQHGIWHRVDDCLQKLARLPDRLLHAPTLRDVRDRRLAEDMLLRTVKRHAAKLHGDRLAVFGNQTQLARDFASDLPRISPRAPEKPPDPPWPRTHRRRTP